MIYKIFREIYEAINEISISNYVNLLDNLIQNEHTLLNGEGNIDRG